MHEIHLVQALVDGIEKDAGERKIKSIKVRFNPLTGRGADHMRFSFELARRDKPRLKTARLDLIEVEPLLRCSACKRGFLGQHLSEVCPYCGSLEVKPVHSTDLVLESIEMED